MKVFFTAALSGKPKYQKVYDRIIQTLKNLDIDVISRETQGVSSIISQIKECKLTEGEAHYMFVKKGITLSDGVIIEASVEKFQLGHEATLALLYNKPVLIISQYKDYSTQIAYPKFIARKYTSLDSLDVIIKAFVDYVNQSQYKKFNFIISSDLDDYLQWKAKRVGCNKSNIIRDMIQTLRDKDEEYNFYLKKKN